VEADVSGDPIGLRHALRGVAVAWRQQRNLRIEAAVGAAALALAAWLGASLVPVLLCCGLVLAAELANSAVEALVDLTSPAPDPRAGRAKDLAAGAVLLAAATSVAVGLVHLGPPLLARLAKGAP
jgi:diacylglycerol kinase (ATP)